MLLKRENYTMVVVVQMSIVPGEARLSEKCSLYRILEHVDDSFRPYVCMYMYVCLSQRGYQNGRELSSRTVFVLSGDLKLSKDTSKKPGVPRSIDVTVSKSWLRQPSGSSQI